MRWLKNHRCPAHARRIDVVVEETRQTTDALTERAVIRLNAHPIHVEGYRWNFSHWSDRIRDMGVEFRDDWIQDLRFWALNVVESGADVTGKSDDDRLGHTFGQERLPEDPVAAHPSQAAFQMAVQDSRTDKHTWKPPDGYVGMNTIINNDRYKKHGKNPTGSTVARWVQRDRNKSKEEGRDSVKIVKAPDNQENHYPEDWILEQIKLWSPR